MNESSADKDSKKREVERDFIPLREQIRSIEKEYNPKNENLHFCQLIAADNALFEKMLKLARIGLTKVKLHHDFFIKGRLYDDSFFWYDMFLLISSAAAAAHHKKSNVKKKYIREIVKILVDISPYSTATGGDMWKRNYGALGNTLIAFYDKDLLQTAFERSELAGISRVKEFVGETILRIEKIRAGER